MNENKSIHCTPYLGVVVRVWSTSTVLLGNTEQKVKRMANNDSSSHNIADKRNTTNDDDDDDVELLDLNTRSSSLDTYLLPSKNPNKLQTVIAILQIITLVGIIIVLGISAATLHQYNANTPTTGPAVHGSVLDESYNNSMLQKQIVDIKSTLQSMFTKLSETSLKVDGIQRFETINQTSLLNQVIRTTSAKLTSIISTLSNIKDTGMATSDVVDDLFGVVQELLELQNASSLFNSITPVSCADIKSVLPDAPTGYYHVNSRNIYCNMDQLCGVTGGWTRIGYLDMSDATQNCPSDFSTYTYQGVRYCKRHNGCSSVSFSTNGLNYTQICGQVTAHQYAHTDAVSPANNAGQGIDGYYVDGISITHGSNPRKHIWTLMSALYDNKLSSTDSCPCAQGSTINIPSFIGNNYYCESGNPNTWYQSGLFYPNDTLWDGQDCAPLESPCCTNPMMPWFYRNLASSISDFIELRQCGNESPYAEDTPTSFYEIYIK